jgi:hypothetical protein
VARVCASGIRGKERTKAATIISHRDRFIPIKTGKSAGTSIEIGLSKVCDGDDVVTELGGKREIKAQFG